MLNYSDRALGIMAGTKPPGNDPAKIAETIRKQGLVLEKYLPFSSDIQTVEEYYSPNPLPESIIQQGKSWLFWYDFKHEYVFDKDTLLEEKQKRLMEALKYSPLGISVFAWAENPDGTYTKLGNDNHWCVCYGYKENEYWKI
mgnify:CR=1 FL=1